VRGTFPRERAQAFSLLREPEMARSGASSLSVVAEPAGAKSIRSLTRPQLSVCLSVGLTAALTAHRADAL
jgi:hypothetical protein